MGKHTAPGSPSPAPVTAAPERGAAGGAHRSDRRPANEDRVGWPGPAAPDVGGLGWAGDLLGQRAAA